MSNLDDILAKLHEGLAQTLLQKVRSGEATAADLNVARQFLKDNGVDAVPKGDTPFANLVTELPFTQPDELPN